MWPYFCVVLSVEHSTDYRDSYFNDGEKKLYAGDIVTVRARFTDEEKAKARLYALVGEQ